MSNLRIRIFPIQYNSQCIGFTEWINLYTLCLAPLIARIISGAPPASYLARTRPKWHDRLCVYNPTSIIWRYAAITDRRIRTISWSRDDLAASNAIFWTSNGWDGAEDLAIYAAPYCTRNPESTHVKIVSGTMVKTVITTLQGVAALYSTLAAAFGPHLPGAFYYYGLDSIFFPLAALGLFRLSAAPWLTEDFQYGSWRETSKGESLWLRQTDQHIQLRHASETLDPFLTPSAHPYMPPSSSWPSRLFRGFYILLLAGSWILAVLELAPFVNSEPAGWVYKMSMTRFLLSIFYLIFMTISIITITFYFAHGRTTNTLLPCISKTWYKAYSVFIFASVLVLIVIASVETSKRPDGYYTSMPVPLALRCVEPFHWGPFGPDSPFMAWASVKHFNSSDLRQNVTALETVHINNGSNNATYWLYKFKGYCLGRLEG